jgi:macrodomain Ter protein organizer (MatP/YcbG family)
MEIKVEKSGIRFKNLDPEYADRAFTVTRFYIGRIERAKVLSIRVPFEVYNRLLLYAKNRRMSVSEVVREAINEYLSKNDKT